MSSLSSNLSSTLSSPSATASCPSNRVVDIPIKIDGGWCGVPVQIGAKNESVNATAAMQACCQGAPIISIENSCDIYCSALNQTTDQLISCLSLNFGALAGNSAGILCSSGASPALKPYSSSKMVVLAIVLVGVGLFTGSY